VSIEEFTEAVRDHLNAEKANHEWFPQLESWRCTWTFNQPILHNASMQVSKELLDDADDNFVAFTAGKLRHEINYHLNNPETYS
jgi:hypothetical protein